MHFDDAYHSFYDAVSSVLPHLAPYYYYIYATMFDHSDRAWLGPHEHAAASRLCHACCPPASHRQAILTDICRRKCPTCRGCAAELTTRHGELRSSSAASLAAGPQLALPITVPAYEGHWPVIWQLETASSSRTTWA